ncbi:MAG: hypothetical protein ACUVRV_00570 [Cyanobacteriota bacterium]
MVARSCQGQGSGSTSEPVAGGAILVGWYRLVQQLAQNDRRQTWLAEQVQEEAQPLAQLQKVVLKLLPFEPGLQWADHTLFQQEVRVLQNLDYPLIPKYCHSKYCHSLEFTTCDHIRWWGLATYRDNP